MMPRDELHVVFGTGAVGLAVMRELYGQGKRVRLVNRSGLAVAAPQNVEVVKGNAADPTSTREVCRNATVVYNCVGAPYSEWAALLPPMQAAIIQGAAAAKAKLVVAENLYMYGPVSGPITETLPFHPTTRKGRVRAKMAEDLMAAHQAGIVRATSGRASDFYGPRSGCARDLRRPDHPSPARWQDRVGVGQAGYAPYLYLCQRFRKRTGAAGRA